MIVKSEFMEVSLFLAKAFGLYLVIMSVALFTRRQEFSNMINVYFASPGLILLSALIAIILGITLVLFHNVWVADWRVVITVLCWWTLIKGCLLIFFPKTMPKITRICQGHCFYVMALLILLLGIFLLWHGFLGSFI